jgi:hypothetical protein
MDKSLSPGFARTTYTGETGVHHHILPVNLDPSAVSGSDPALTLKDESTALASTVLGSYWNVAKELLSIGQNIGLCEIYKVNAATGEGIFLYGFDLGLEGTVAGTTIPMQMQTQSFKLTNGRIWKAVFMDAPFPVNQKLYPPFADGLAITVFADFVVSDLSPVYGRGNAYPFAPISFTTKTSDVLRKREGLV